MILKAGLKTSVHKYFHSGWAFLTPYLATYLLYRWLDWPVNPPSAESVEPSAGSIGGNADGEAPLPFAPCSLLTLYWALHGIHLILAAIVLHSWWRSAQRAAGGKEASAKGEKCAESENSPLHSTPLAHGASPLARSPLRREAASPWRLALSKQAYGLLPWALLALIFYIPEVYLEFPADPWEHLRRINEWNRLTAITSHSHWHKTGYFIPFSVFGWINNAGIQSCLASYYVAATSLLLCWQFYRLGRTAGLNTRIAFLFILINVIIFGNNTFSFYRYYGLSTTMFSQIGAVALIRIALESILSASTSQLRLTCFSLTSALGILMLISFNHFQGVVIAAIGILGLIMWHLSRVHPRILIGGLAVLSLSSIAVALTWPQSPAMANVPKGWLTPWAAFDLFSFTSPAALRAWQILGAAGLANFVFGVVLLARNHPVGWLTVTPGVVLCIPVLAVPIAAVLVHETPANILAFHRILLAIPAGLAAATLYALYAAEVKRKMPAIAGQLALPMAVIALLLITLAPAGRTAYNRWWHLTMIAPDDLSMLSVQAAASDLPLVVKQPDGLYATMSRISFVLETLKPIPTVYKPYYYRGFQNDRNLPSIDFRFIDRAISNPTVTSRSFAIIISPLVNYSASSQAAQASGHWLPVEVPLGYAGMKELRGTAEENGLSSGAIGSWLPDHK